MTSEQGDNLYQQNTDLEVMELLLPYVKQFSFLDIGAEKGEFTRFFSKHGFQGIFFEPLPQCAHELTQLAQQTGCIFSSYAVDATDRTADFYHAYDKADNDVQYFSSLHPLENDSRINHKKVTTVQCRSLDSLLEEGFVSPSIGVIKIDTEGNDLNILKGMNQVSAEVLMCEFFMPKIYAGWELGHPLGIIQRAKELGFNHFMAIKRIEDFEFISLNNASFMDRQWGNLIFFSDEIYQQAESVIHHYLAQKEPQVINYFLAKVDFLQKACDERLVVIDGQLREITRLKETYAPHMTRLEKYGRSWLKKLKLLINGA